VKRKILGKNQLMGLKPEELTEETAASERLVKETRGNFEKQQQNETYGKRTEEH
jgi:hypothetical protein